jgi:hypothetical protein
MKKLSKVSKPSYHRDREPKDDRRLGDPVKPDFLSSCVTCMRWSICKDNSKSAMYKCSRYKAVEMDENSQEAFEDYDEKQEKVSKKLITSLFDQIDDSQESSILDMVEAALTANLPVPPDLRVRDANFRQAPNFLSWSTDNKFAGNGVPPFPRQIEIGTLLFSEFCPRPKCTDVDWWENKLKVNTPITEMMDRVSFLEFGVCPKCKSKRSDLILNNKLPNYYSLVGLAGQRAAKTSSVVLWESYNLHKMVMLPNPSTAFGTLATQPIVSTFVAMTFNQAVENVWVPFRNILTTAPWYQDYFSFLTDEGRKLGEELFQLGENSLRFRHRNLIYAPVGPNKRTGRGRTRFCLSGDTLIHVLENDQHIKLSDPSLEGKHTRVNGYITKIKKRHDNGTLPTYTLTLTDGKKIRATADHKFVMYNMISGREMGLKVADLTPFDYFVTETYETNPNGSLKTKIAYVALESIKFYGKEPVYDIEVEHDDHVFLANGILSKNSVIGDEFGWFPLFSKQNKELERLDAKGVDIAMTRSLFTLKSAHTRRLEEGFDDMPRPMKYLVSSPSALNDYIMTSYRKALGSKEILRFKYKSWEYNPLLRKKDFAEEFRDDPVAASRDYECNPPMGEGLFLKDNLGLEKCQKGKNAFNVHTSLSKSNSGSTTTSSEVEILREPKNPHACILSIDVGIVNNSFAFSVITLPEDYIEPTHDSGDEDMDSEEGYLTPVRIIGCGEVIPKAGAPLSLTKLYNKCLRPLVEFFDCRVLVSDRWQNAKIASDLNDKYGIETYEVRAKWQDFAILRELINQNEIQIPKPVKSLEVIQQTLLDNYPETFLDRAQDHLYWQLMSVREQTNVTVIKPDSGTDDLFRTIVLGASLLQEEEVRDLIYLKGNVDTNQETGSLALTKGFSKAATPKRTVTVDSTGNALALVKNRR